jgi:hypothetical protein
VTKPYATRAAALLLAGLGAVSLLAACSGSGKAAVTANNTGRNGLQAYLTCLSNHGVTLPSRGPGARPSVRPSGAPRPSRSPGTGGGGFGGGNGGGFGGGGFGGGFTDPSTPPSGVDAATWAAALSACQSVQPSFGGGQGGFNNSAFTAYRNCLSDHGVTFSTGPNGLDPNDPKVAAALKTCAPLRPSGRPSGSPSASG